MILLSARDIQERLKISRNVSYQLLHRADIQTVRIGRRLLVAEDELERWLKGGGAQCLKD